MKFLKQIINLLSKYEVKVDLFNEEEARYTSSHKLYTGVQNGLYSTEEEAALDIYRTTTLDARFRNLKSRLKKKLTNQLFFLQIETPKYSESLAARYEAERLAFSMRVLGALGADQAAYEYALQALSLSEKFHFTKIAVDCLDLLLGQASTTCNHKEFQKYSNLLSHYTNILLAELKAREAMQRLNMHFITSQSVNEDIHKEIEKIANVVTSLWKEYKSFSLFLANFRAHFYQSQIRGDYLSGLEVCTEAEQFYKDHPHLKTTARMIELIIHKNTALFYLRRYTEGIQYAREHLHLMPAGSGNWFSFLIVYFQLLFHANEISEAKELYETVISHINFDIATGHRKDSWKIFGLYLSFVEGREIQDMEQFIKGMEMYRSDKSGVYVAVLALSILVLLRKGDYDSIITRDEYLKKYLTRYLSGNDHIRSATFFRLLRLLIKNDFKLDAVQKLGAKHIAVLYDSSLWLDDYEVMPYERMWEYVVQMIAKKSGSAPYTTGLQ